MWARYWTPRRAEIITPRRQAPPLPGETPGMSWSYELRYKCDYNKLIYESRSIFYTSSVVHLPARQVNQGRTNGVPAY